MLVSEFAGVQLLYAVYVVLVELCMQLAPCTYCPL